MRQSQHGTQGMRQGQQNKRMRGRGRSNKMPNQLNRVYESNGPDVKIRGTAAHIAEKYAALSRDAHASGDPVSAESYMQHAEHYFRIIAAAQSQMQPPVQQPGYDQAGNDQDDDGQNDDGDYSANNSPGQAHKTHESAEDGDDEGSEALGQGQGQGQGERPAQGRSRRRRGGQQAADGQGRRNGREAQANGANPAPQDDDAVHDTHVPGTQAEETSEQPA